MEPSRTVGSLFPGPVSCQDTDKAKALGPGRFSHGTLEHLVLAFHTFTLGRTLIKGSQGPNVV